jgi:hypothetical protein
MGLLKESEAMKLDNDTPANQLVGIGAKTREVQLRTGLDDGLTGIIPALMLTYAITADATGNPVMWTATFPCEVIDVIVQSRAASGSGTATVGKGASAITNAMTMAVDNTMARAGTIARANSTLAIGDTLNVDCNGSTDRGLITVILKRL